MSSADLRALIDEIRAGRQEDAALELKRKWWDLDTDRGKNDLVSDVAGMANGRGELRKIVVLGVDGDGTLHNSAIPCDEARIQDVLRRRMNPIPHVRIEEFECEGPRVSILSVEPPFDRPHVAVKDDRHYIPFRRGSQVTTATRHDLDQMYAGRRRQPAVSISWIAEPSDDDTDDHEIRGAKVTDVVSLMRPHPVDFENLARAVRMEREEVAATDLEGDEEYAKRRETYLKQVEKYLEAIGDPAMRQRMYASDHWAHAKWFRIGVANSGSAVAHDLDLTLGVPPWLRLYESRPHRHGLPTRPEPPQRPDKAAQHLLATMQGFLSQLPHFPDLTSGFDRLHVPVATGVRDTSGLRNGLMELQFPEVPHDRAVYPSKRFAMLASPAAPEGAHELPLKLFYKELDAPVGCTLRVWIQT